MDPEAEERTLISVYIRDVSGSNYMRLKIREDCGVTAELEIQSIM